MFDLVECVRDRYVGTKRPDVVRWEVWSDTRQISAIPSGVRLRVIDRAPFVLEYTSTDWSQSSQRTALGTGIGVWLVDLTTDRMDRVRFRFHYRDATLGVGPEHTIEIGSR